MPRRPGCARPVRGCVAALGGEAFRQTYPNGDRVEFTVCVFACEVETFVPVALDGEADAFRWVAPDDVPALLDLPYPPELFGPLS